jgi:ABC-2 type transport system ATP-binding protein
MPENDVYISGLLGFEFVAYCGQLYGMPRTDAISRAHQVLHFVGLGEARYRTIDDYSAGMRQRVKLAACLVHGPELLLLDEPTTGLDPAGREQMLDLIDNVSHECGVSVLFSSHILRDIEQTCERLVVLNEGRVLFGGLRKDFQAGTGVDDVAGFRSTGPRTRRYLLRVKAGRKKMAEALEAKGYLVSIEMAHLEVDLPQEIQPEHVWALARAQGLQVRHLAPLGESLEDAYNRALVDKSVVPQGGA